jgi:DNA-binding transcriptional regulator of glucitol operon
LHVALIVFVPGCVALTWWQASRALSGNTLSWVYTFEWPIFGAYAVYMWWKLLHDEPDALAEPAPESEAGARSGSGAGTQARTVAEPGAEADGERREEDELAAYNRYLADLNASGRQKRW